jgi:hypothetical protein
MKEKITKSDWHTCERCSVKAWFEFRASNSGSPSEAERFRMEQGQEIGKRAQKLYPDGILVVKRDGKSALQITEDLISNPSTETLFEAAFAAGPFTAKADILRREGGKWHALEVKSKFSNTGDMKELVEDLAYTVFVLRRSGVNVTRASLVLLTRTFRFGDNSERLFQIIDKTEDVNARITEFEKMAEGVARMFFDGTRPRAQLVSGCRECGFFGNECLGSGLAHTVLEIPNLPAKKLRKLSEIGVIDLWRLPGDFELNDLQKRMTAATLSNRLAVEPGLNAALQSIEWPCHYLDFETVATVLPLYPGYGCHEQVLTQFSIHHRESSDVEPSHSEFLADATRDCQRQLAEALIQKLGDRGAIIVYSNFEETRIKALQKAFPDLAERLQAILQTVTNLLPLIREHVYHPSFVGSFSIKKVLPAVVPELSYAGLKVADGDTAITRFARMARGEISGDAVEVTRQQLLDYCKMDTLAMVRLHETLLKLAAEREAGSPP